MIRTHFEPARRGRTAPQRVLLFPPAQGNAADFVREGFADAVRERGLDLDLALIELELKSMTDREALADLRRQALAPARAAGCRTLWLGGISRGGYVALLCAERHRCEVDGLCLIAPYLGSHLWRFIQAHGRGPLPIHLGIGRDFAARHRLLAEALAPQPVDVVPGGHEWPVWRTLWEIFLDARFVAAGR